MDPMHILCVLNAASGTGLSVQRWPKVAACLDSFGLVYDLLEVRGGRSSEPILSRFEQTGLAQYAAVVGIGGDGTHSAIINALMHYRRVHPQETIPPYALIPMGTGNDIGKSFGIDLREMFFAGDLRRAVAAIRYGADYMLDLGFMDGLYFADALTIGLDSRILKEHNLQKRNIARFPWLRRVIKGNLLYTWCAGLRLWRQVPVEAVIIVDGAPWYAGKIVNMVINNTRVYAGEFVLAPDAYANDGLLEVVVFTGQTDYLTKYLLQFRTNPREIQKLAQRLNKVASFIQGRRIEVRLSQAEPAQYDGEELPAKREFNVQVVPRAVRLRLPAEPA